MTKQELKIIHEACELIETRSEKYSCNALVIRDRSGLMRRRYSAFYDQCTAFWDNEDLTYLNREQRILLLLLFAEVGFIE